MRSARAGDGVQSSTRAEVARRRGARGRAGRWLGGGAPLYGDARTPTARRRAARWRAPRSAGGLRVGGAAAGRVVLEAAVLRRVVRGGDHHAVGEARRCARGCAEDGVRDDGGGRVLRVARRRTTCTPLAAKHLQGGAQRGLGEGVGVRPEEEGPVDRPARARYSHDRLRDGEDVVLVEAALERRCPGGRRCRRRRRCSGFRGSGRSSVVGGDEPVGVGAELGRHGLSCQGMVGAHRRGSRAGEEARCARPRAPLPSPASPVLAPPDVTRRGARGRGRDGWRGGRGASRRRRPRRRG